MMWEGAGLEVHNIGINNSVEEYLEAIEKYDADILGMSAMLTTTMSYMKVVIDTLKDMGKRNDIIVLVGGAPLGPAFAEEIEADAYCADASEAAEAAKKFLAMRRK
jgi:5-methyltetrahydrofolate--homocysteine methyltransferase